MVIAIRPIREIPFFKEYVKAKPINEGYSDDIKYIVWLHDKKYLLRLSSKDDLEKKKCEYKILKSYKKLNIPKVYACGEVDEYSYIIYDYIEGENANVGIKKLTQDKQYEMGVLAGKMLREFHKEASCEKIDYKHRFEEKLALIKNIEVPCLERMCKLFYDFIDLDDSNPVYCHGDYHCSNMIVNKDLLYAIDFNRFKIASPYSDFRRLFTFSRTVSVPFCRGQLDGYFGRRLEENDFKKMLPYLIYELVSMMYWSADNKQLVELYKVVLDDFNNFTTIIPNWYYFHS